MKEYFHHHEKWCFLNVTNPDRIFLPVLKWYHKLPVKLTRQILVNYHYHGPVQSIVACKYWIFQGYVNVPDTVPTWSQKTVLLLRMYQLC